MVYYKDLKKRTKKAIQGNLQKLIQKYGEDEVKLVVNKYFQNLKDKRNAEELIKQKERELNELKGKI